MEKENDLISIIIPSYNRAHSLAACLDSILNQTYSNIEVIVVDNNSIDNTKQLVKSYAEKDSRVIYMEEHKQGVSFARNKALDNLSKDSKYIMFVDSDDIIDKTICEKLHKASSEMDVDLSIALYTRKFKKRSVGVEKVEFAGKKLHGKDLKDNFIELFEKWLITISVAKLYSTKKMQEKHIRFREDMVIFEDKIFNFDYIDYDTTWTVINEYLYTYVYNTESITTTFKPSRITDTENAFERSIEVLKSKNFCTPEIVNKMINEFGQSSMLLVDNILGDKELSKSEKKKYIVNIVNNHNNKLKEEYKEFLQNSFVELTPYNRVLLTKNISIIKAVSHLRRVSKKMNRG